MIGKKVGTIDKIPLGAKYGKELWSSEASGNGDEVKKL